MPISDNKNPLSPSVFLPTALLREARRQKHLATAEVPAVCILDPDGRYRAAFAAYRSGASFRELALLSHRALYVLAVRSNGRDYRLRRGRTVRCPDCGRVVCQRLPVVGEHHVGRSDRCGGTDAIF